MNTPANGPISEYGRYRTVSAAAAAVGLVNVSALKNTYVPIPAVRMPSPVCETRRVENSRRKSRSASTTRRSETKADRVIQLITRSSAHPPHHHLPPAPPAAALPADYRPHPT